MPAPASSYKTLRRQLDDLGYYQVVQNTIKIIS